MGDVYVQFGRRVQNDMPVRARIQWSGVGGGFPIEVTEPSQIRALFNSLAEASIEGEASEIRTDDYIWISFDFADEVSSDIIGLGVNSATNTSE